MPAHPKARPASRTTEDQPADQIDFRKLYYTLRERIWVIALCLLVAGLGITAYLIRAPRIYVSRLVLQVEQGEQKILNIQRVQQEDPQSLEFLKTVEQTLQSRSLLERVLETNNLAGDPRFVRMDDGPRPTQEQLVTRLSRMVEAKLRKGTRLIDVKVEHTDPQIAALIAGSVYREFMSQNFEHTSSTADNAYSFLQNEEKRLKEQLGASEREMQEFKERTKSVSLEDRQNVVVEKLKELNQKVTEAKSQRILQETTYNQAMALSNNVGTLLFLQTVANDPAIIDIRANISRLESELANLRQRYREKHPRYIQTVSQLDEWKSNLTNSVLNIPQVIRSLYESAKSSESALEAALREQEDAALELNKQALVYNGLARAVDSDRALYEAVLNRIKETTLTKEIRPDQIRIVQDASVPEFPAKPEKLKITLIGLVAGLALGITLALFLSSLDRSLRTVDQAEDFLGVPVLSAIPKFSGVQGQERKLINSEDAECGEAEAFRTLRTSLSMLGRKEDRRVFLFTSAIPSEGKTFCSLNYGISLAQQGLRTLIIDCDLRRPMVETSLLNNNQRGFGLTDYLIGQKDFNSIVHPTETENFFYIPAGAHAPNPAELLARTGIDAVIDEALLQFERIIIDSAPIHAVSDTLLILNRVQTLCLVVRSGKTPRNSVHRAVQMLKEAGAPLAGVILNLIPRARGGYGYYYDSYYSYGYYGKYGYGKEREAEKARTEAA
ncbi:MAG TPA: polysaccharide biosynthesis tyrosine autokinase [Candidatus Saccharimonadales bacterium]|nr:polysaccharide biosynthesis tyrosine autokinase [Candidatus Saccharimonadales bacterium]